MKNDLVERYLYAVTKRLNPKIRDDVKKELEALIDDMLTERCGGAQPTEKDVRVVLTELGTPQELYAKYDGSSGKCLIGQPYYNTYKLVMEIVLPSVALGMTVSSIMIHFVETQLWYETLLSWFSMMWSGMLQGFAIVTLIFAIFNHKGVKLGESYNLDDLPPVPKKKEEISRGDCIFSIAFSVVFMVIMLAVPQYIIGYWGPDKVVALFNTDALRSSWYLILIFGSMDIVRSTIRLLEGRYNRKVMIGTVVTNCIAAVAAILWLTNPHIINPEFVTHVQDAFAGEAKFIQDIFLNFGDFFLAVILIALAADTAKAVIKYLKK